MLQVSIVQQVSLGSRRAWGLRRTRRFSQRVARRLREKMTVKTAGRAVRKTSSQQTKLCFCLFRACLGKFEWPFFIAKQTHQKGCLKTSYRTMLFCRLPRAAGAPAAAGGDLHGDRSADSGARWSLRDWAGLPAILAGGEGGSGSRLPRADVCRVSLGGSGRAGLNLQHVLNYEFIVVTPDLT